MIEQSLKNSILGFAELSIEGLSLERFFSLCAENNIKLYKVSRKSYTQLIVTLDGISYKRLKKKLKKTPFRVKVLRKGGLPVRINSKRYKYILIPSAIAAIFFLIAISCFVWEVEYTGFDRNEVFEIMELAENMGLYEGALKSNIDKNEIIGAVRAEFDDVAWISISFYGTKAVVAGVTSEFSVNDIPENNDSAVCDIVALKDGYITDIRVYNGTKIADNGQTVKKGDLLVSGDIYFGDNELPSYSVHSEADVFATVVYHGQASSPAVSTASEPTGNSYTQRYIDIFGNLHLLGEPVEKFSQYTAQVENEYILGKNMPLFFKIYDITYYETVDKQITADENILFSQLCEEAYYKALSGIEDPDSITSVNYTTKKNDDILTASVIIETTENIAACYYR